MSDENGTLRIIELQAENVKRLKAVRLKPDATLVRIEGRNAQGKSSVLDAIAAALGGGKWNPAEPVRRGAKKARVTLDLGDLKVERRWTARGGTVLEITSNGARMASPQSILDKLVGDLTFDPLRFVHMPAKEQASLLRKLAGLDFSEIEAKRDQLYAERTVANRRAKEAAARVGDMPPKPASMELVSVRELADKQERAFAHNRAVDDAMRSVTDAKSACVAAKEEVDRLVSRLAEARNTLKAAEERAGAAQEQAERMEHADVSDLRAQIEGAEKHNAAIEARRSWEERDKAARAAEEEAEALDEQIKAVDAEKDRALADAKFPLDGLGIGVDGPTLNGIPFSQASSAEQLRTGVAIGLAGKPKARIMLIRDGSLLDSGNMQELNRIAEEFDAQVFVERVAESAAPSAVYIEDGEIVEGGNDE